MEGYGASGVIVMDSAGALLTDDVRRRVSALVEGTGMAIGYHGHDNVSLGVANSIAAVEEGATILDGTARGFGAGAGNTQLEVLVAVLHAARPQNRDRALQAARSGRPGRARARADDPDDRLGDDRERAGRRLLRLLETGPPHRGGVRRRPARRLLRARQARGDRRAGGRDTRGRRRSCAKASRSKSRSRCRYARRWRDGDAHSEAHHGGSDRRRSAPAGRYAGSAAPDLRPSAARPPRCWRRAR